MSSASTSYRARQKARGLCISCRLRAEPGRTRCAEHLARDREYSRARFGQVRIEWRIALAVLRYLDSGWWCLCGEYVPREQIGCRECGGASGRLQSGTPGGPTSWGLDEPSAWDTTPSIWMHGPCAAHALRDPLSREAASVVPA